MGSDAFGSARIGGVYGLTLSLWGKLTGVTECCKWARASRAVFRGGLRAASADRVLIAASVGRTLSPPASVVVLLKSDFLAYFC